MSTQMNALRPAICRVCMAPTAPEASINIFASSIPDADCCSLAELLALVGGIDVRPDEPGGLPEWCCYRCKLDMATAYRVRILCQESDRKLREALAKEADEVVCKIEVEEAAVESTGCEEDESWKLDGMLPKGAATVESVEPEDVKPLPIEIEGFAKESIGYDEMDNDQRLNESDAMEIGGEEGAKEPETKMFGELYDYAWREPTTEFTGCEKADETKVDCSEDGEPSNQASEIFEEITVVDQRRCCTCRTIFNNLEELLEHAKREHAVQDPPADTKIMKLCRICYKLICKKSYKQHTSTPRTIFRCKTCDKLFLFANSVFVHHLKDHFTSKKCCGVKCNAVFDSLEALQQHSEQVHLPEKGPPDPRRPVVCQTCFKTFLSHCYLYLHRTRIEQFKCSHCQEGFRTRNALKQHMVIHTGSTLHCKSCNKTYKHRRDLFQHNVKVHGIKGPHRCNLCPTSYVRASALVRHKRNRHGITTNQRNQKSAMEEGALVSKVEVEELSRLQEREEDDDDEY